MITFKTDRAGRPVDGRAEVAVQIERMTEIRAAADEHLWSGQDT